MFKAKSVFSSFSVKEIAEIQRFYTEILGLKVDDDEMGLVLNLPGGTRVFVYQKDDHTPASFTILNFEVENIDEAMEALKKKGVTFERYNNPDLPQDDKGVFRGLNNNSGPDIAWFKDPAGNVISVLQN